MASSKWVSSALLFCTACGQILGSGDYRTSDEPDVTVRPVSTCPPTEAPMSDGTCVTVGVRPDGCVEGLHLANDGGCAYDYPPCRDDFLVSAPSNNCRLLNCAVGTPGGYDQYVDGAYAGSDSDGTSARPWKRIQDAVDHASDGGSVFVAGAPGPYEENVVLDRGVSLGGACRRSVEIHGATSDPAVTIHARAATTGGLSQLTVTGGKTGVLVVGHGSVDAGGAFAVSLDTIGVHDVSGPGMDLRDAAVSVTDSYVRDVVGAGISVSVSTGVSGVGLELAGSSVQSVDPSPSAAPAACLMAGLTPGAIGTRTGPVGVRVHGSLLQDCADAGISASGTDLSIEGSVIRRIRPTERSGTFVLGRGITVEQDSLYKAALFSTAAGLDATLTLKASLLEDIGDVAVSLRNVKTATIDGTTIRNVRGSGEGVDSGSAPCREAGIGLLALAEPNDDADAGYLFQSRVDVSNTVVSGARVAGVELQGVTATLDRVLVEDTAPDLRHDCPEAFGDGIVVHSSKLLRTGLDVKSSRIERTARAAIASFGAGGDVVVESAAIGCAGRGLVTDLHAPPMRLPGPDRVVCSCEGPAHPCTPERADLPPSRVGSQ